MIFFGRRATRIKDGTINHVTCPNCDTQTSFTFSVFGKYAHVYWVPMFPMGKETVLECDNCKRTYKAEELPENIKQKAKAETKYAKAPIWNFAGLAIVAAVTSLLVYEGNQIREDNAKFINNPEVGDVYSTKDSSTGFYTAAKVTKVTNDSLYLTFSDYEIDKRSGVSEVDKEEFYNDQTAAYSRSEVLSLFEEKIIFDVSRK